MKYHKLRIAASAFLGLLTVAMIVLWVRSYSYWDGFQAIAGYRIFSVVSDSGYVSPAIAVALGEDELMRMSLGQFHESQKLPEGRQGPFSGFDFKRNPVYTALVVPHWFAALLFASLAMLPWLRWPTSTAGPGRQNHSCT